MPESTYAAQLDLVKRISGNLNKMKENVEAMTEARKKANEVEDPTDKAKAYCFEVKPLMEAIRTYADRLEYLVDDREWPMVKYRELMFVR